MVLADRQAGAKAVITSRAVSATPDGLLISRANDVVDIHGAQLRPGSDYGVGLEIKSRGPNAKGGLPKFEHKKQAELQIELWNRVTGIQVDAVLLFYGCRDRYDEIDVFKIARNPAVWKAASAVAEKVYGTADPFDIAPEGRAPSECKYCPFRVRCGMGELRVPDRRDPELSLEEASHMKHALQMRQLAVAQEKAAKDAKVKAEHSIKTILRRNDTNFVEIGSATVGLSRVKGRATLDKVALAEKVDLTNYTKTGEPSIRLNIRGKV